MYIRKGTIIAVSLLAAYGIFEGGCELYSRFIVPAITKAKTKKEVKPNDETVGS